MYHEKQIKELCALHTLNNLFQEKLFSKEELDKICETLDPSRWFNPHRSMLGTGNYDINVILTALETIGYGGIWFDKRKNPKLLNLDNVKGFILNAPNNYVFGVLKLPINRRHWHAISRSGDEYYNFDSKLPAPVLIGKEDALLEYLHQQLQEDRQLFVVAEKAVETSRSWIRPEEEEEGGGKT